MPSHNVCGEVGGPEWCDRPTLYAGGKLCKACTAWQSRNKGKDIKDRPKPTKGARPTTTVEPETCRTPWCDRPQKTHSRMQVCKACLHWWYRNGKQGDPWDRPQPDFAKVAADGDPKCLDCNRPPAKSRRRCWACIKRHQRGATEVGEFIDRRHDYPGRPAGIPRTSNYDGTPGRRATANDPKDDMALPASRPCHMCGIPKSQHTQAERSKCANDMITKPPPEPKKKKPVRNRSDAGAIMNVLG